MSDPVNQLLDLVENSLSFDGTTVRVLDAEKFRKNVGKLVERSALASDSTAGWSRFLVRAAALELGVYAASIHELYMARGRGEAPMTFTTPAFNLRALSHYAARAMFRAANKINAGAFIFELARSEMSYTDQRPSEYATNILGAAVAEGYQGPIFIQGDHFQVSAKKYKADAAAELKAVRDLSIEAMAAGFYNIDVDTSTLVDIHLPTVEAQQELNSKLSAELSAFIRENEPAGVTISIGGEIGEVGTENSTEPELRAYMDAYNANLKKLAPGKPGLSKISVLTGTSHGGTVLPDGSIAEVNIAFDVLRDLSRVARKDYGMGGTVQHGASTVPEENFNKFVQHEAIEVHLATNFATMFFDNIPADFKKEMYVWLDVNSAADRKPGMTDEQFYYKVRKNAIGPFKAKSYALPAESLNKLGAAWEAQFDKLFNLLGLKDTKQFTDKYIKPVKVQPVLADYVKQAVAAEDVSDLSD
ncbi:MAG: class II fructose-bisphosphate aldolase [Anaerolineales bacterium]|uniref:class II fructose-bisphosphate aldolase n=1 Tax=Candidatus Villigracilis vicinus TaxID=3140679 RepID=UPI00313559F1|nr:class II fructose-bisphosphate aldolase [Anaerolineales bacterium]MBK7449166.1 class II fructose-bisphosphate aldolase [Anaerolineales bacterium]